MTLNRFHFHLIRLCTLAGQNVLALQIAVHHDDDSFVIVQITDNGGNLVHPRQLTGALPPMPGHNFISAVRHRSGDNRHQHSIFLHALHRFHHPVIVQYAEWMIFEGVKFA